MTQKHTDTAELVKALQVVANCVISCHGVTREDIYAAAARLKELQAVVDKLPKTADGVPVVPGMRLWWNKHHDKKERPEIVSGVVWTVEGRAAFTDYDGFDAMPYLCYSTQAAAESAHPAKPEQAQQGGEGE